MMDRQHIQPEPRVAPADRELLLGRGYRLLGIASLGTLLVAAGCGTVAVGTQRHGDLRIAGLVGWGAGAPVVGALVYGGGPIIHLTRALRHTRSAHPDDLRTVRVGTGWAAWSRLFAVAGFFTSSLLDALS